MTEILAPRTNRAIHLFTEKTPDLSRRMARSDHELMAAMLTRALADGVTRASKHRCSAHVGSPGGRVRLTNILNGREHADNNVASQKFMIISIGAATFSEVLRREPGCTTR